MFSVRWNRFEIAKYLVEHGANIHANGEMALFICSNKGYLNIMEYLVEKGAEISGEMLWLAAARGHLDIFKYVVNHVDSEKKPDYALYLSAMFGREDVFNFILSEEKGGGKGDINAFDEYCLYKRNSGIIEYLKNAGKRIVYIEYNESNEFVNDLFDSLKAFNGIEYDYII